MPALGAVAEWLRSGLQSRLHRFDSGRRLALQSGVAALCRQSADGRRDDAGIGHWGIRWRPPGYQTPERSNEARTSGRVTSRVDRTIGPMRRSDVTDG